MSSVAGFIITRQRARSRSPASPTPLAWARSPIAPVPSFSRLRPSCPTAAIPVLDFHPLAAGADDRLDELAIGVLVAAIDELGQRLRPIRRSS